ncbi:MULTISPECIES: HIT family protein [Shouchella]|jgi:diadenosine tetraphosphate (Ap4A) HIT family hydrolase|uniref:HIT domain-containing protein n=3 Tax=Shouchella TaxID=2893057 RepID=Q5WJT9_SHOC1|nr:DeoR family transcriptional regulator [Shouchella clausii]MCM3314204.1 hypothetical protein [Psychrobacillus sp. MER TA 17]PAD16011.1 hypothetical protein CHH73_13810 [Shouchella clausii]PAE88227.1 hypothetical protein CHH72_14040 [Shouchella clausii]PAE92779.1 hypothetical protein CHH70_13850 [Shouchella clausii]BAD63366.1 conserved hypothetical protein [Shouchella clausii KSM-K16]
MKELTDWKKDRILAARNGKNPMVITVMKSGYAVIGDTQFLPGYCVLLPFNRVNSIEDLVVKDRMNYMLDMTLIGEAILKVCKPKRINYSIYGNTDAFLHAHIFPRYNWESNEMITQPVWKYSALKWSDEEYQYAENKHGNLKESLKKELEDRMKFTY